MTTETFIVELDLSIRLKNGLRNIGCNKIIDILKLSKYDIEKSKRFGASSKTELFNFLSDNNLKLKS